MLALMVFYGALYVICSEFISLQPARGEVLLFRKGHYTHRRTPDNVEGRG